MGVYLSEPNKEKHTVEGTGVGYSFVSAEMQGNCHSSQDGEKACKTQPSIHQISEMATDFSQFLMDMEVLLLSLRILG